MIYSRIAGTGSHLPKRVVTNHDLEKVMETSDQWIRERTGICSRRVVSDGETTVSLGEEACRKALESADVDPAEIDLFVMGTTTPDLVFPSSACLIQKRLGLPDCGAMDVNAACSGFMYALSVADKYVRAGDVIQVVLSQRFSGVLDADPFDVYRALRTINPSPYMFYLQFNETRIIGASPEVLVRKEGTHVEVRPIAGTRPRGATFEADQAYEEELLADPKERAEHIMLVDLGRNDLGRVCQTGSVQVDELMVVERYSHVMHIVSNVSGQLLPGYDALDVFSATFPAGTLSGAPKIRAMEIIEELEPVRREIYGGAVGYISFDGNMDLAIAIRTLVTHQDMIHLQAGAGIVADSDPAAEYEETVNKAMGVKKAIELARQGLD